MAEHKTDFGLSDMPNLTQKNPSKYIFSSKSFRYSTQLIDLHELDADQVVKWKQLAANAICANPFYHPEFLLPLASHLRVDGVKLLVVVDHEGDWQFAAPVVSYFFEQGLPLPKLRAVRSDYIFLDSPLLSNENSTEVIHTLLNSLSSQRNWHGIGFGKTLRKSLQAELLELAAISSDVELRRREVAVRPCVSPQPQDELLTKCSRNRRKTLRKGWKRLSQQGEIKYQLRIASRDISPAVSDFLKLEALGWKGTSGTALDCDASHANFFRDMCTGFSNEQRVVFGELHLDGEVISSTCNLLAGDTLFAFKIGWNPDFSECSLGYWSEILLADAVCKELKNVRLIDSCSNEESYTAKVWQERLEIQSLLLIWSRRAKLIRGAKDVVKKVIRT